MSFQSALQELFALLGMDVVLASNQLVTSIGWLLIIAWIAVLVWVARDCATRSSNLFFQVFCLIVVSLPVTPLITLPVYLIIRPRRRTSPPVVTEDGGSMHEGIVCSACHHLNDADHNFCVFCGESLKWTCGSCGTSNDPRFAFCYQCGGPKANATKQYIVTGKTDVHSSSHKDEKNTSLSLGSKVTHATSNKTQTQVLKESEEKRDRRDKKKSNERKEGNKTKSAHLSKKKKIEKKTDKNVVNQIDNMSSGKDVKKGDAKGREKGEKGEKAREK